MPITFLNLPNHLEENGFGCRMLLDGALHLQFMRLNTFLDLPPVIDNYIRTQENDPGLLQCCIEKCTPFHGPKISKCRNYGQDMLLMIVVPVCEVNKGLKFNVKVIWNSIPCMFTQKYAPLIRPYA